MWQDKEKWNKKFSSREEELFAPEPYIIKNINSLEKGSVLDIACGDGRNAIYLAQQGFEVTGVDISDVGLKRLQHFAEQQKLQIETCELDLDLSITDKLGKFDNIVISHFKPPSTLWQELPKILRKPGTLICCTFNAKQHYTYGFPLKFCLQDSELADIHPDLQLEEMESTHCNRKFLDGYIFKKK